MFFMPSLSVRHSLPCHFKDRLDFTVINYKLYFIIFKKTILNSVEHLDCRALRIPRHIKPLPQLETVRSPFGAN